MDSIQDIFTAFTPQYLERFKDHIPQNHIKVIDAIIACRTQRCGITVYECNTCRKSHFTFRSCGNRHCPTCQHHKTIEWLDRQNKRHLPGHHFMLTFTMPSQIRSFVRSNQRLSYGAMFAASSNTIKKLTKDEKYIGGDMPGFFGVLHTWGRQLQYHPHIHYIVPGGALSSKNNTWHCSRLDFFLPVKVLSQIFKAKFRDLMVKADRFHDIPPEVWGIDWNVNCQAIGSSVESIRYLAPYVFKVAISNTRIVKVQNDRVFYRYKKSGCHRWRTVSVEAIEFIRRFLQHALPTGFMKVRYYGILHPRSAIPLDKVRILIEMAHGFDVIYRKPPLVEKTQPVCSHCGGKLTYLYSILPYMLPPKGFG